jgi:hypothetical protein
MVQQGGNVHGGLTEAHNLSHHPTGGDKIGKPGHHPIRKLARPDGLILQHR